MCASRVEHDNKKPQLRCTMLRITDGTMHVHCILKSHIRTYGLRRVHTISMPYTKWHYMRVFYSTKHILLATPRVSKRKFATESEGNIFCTSTSTRCGETFGRWIKVDSVWGDHSQLSRPRNLIYFRQVKFIIELQVELYIYSEWSWSLHTRVE